MKIAFTACMDAERMREQPVWDRIRGEQPDVLMLLGDQVYMDWGDLGASGWRTAIRREPVKGLEAFAVELHRRYALQWEVASFRALVTGFAGRADPSRLLVTWDDHDYAWNNSLGFDGEDEKLYRHGVPPKVKAVSRRLFDQFLQQLRGAPAGAAYPPLPSDWNQPLPSGQDQGLFWRGALGAGEGPECLLLDTRWHREARVGGASILGAGQRESLHRAVSTTGAGLLLVAGGTPMSCKYLFSQQAWHGLQEPSYVEYDETLAAARRPVLYIGGDVHRNVWSGRLRSTQGQAGEVVQVLSSGAAIGRIGPKRFAPSFGVLEIPPGSSERGEARLSLWAQDKAGQWREDPPTPPLPFDAARWTAPLDAEAASLVDGAADEEPLTILAARVRAGTVKSSVPSPHGLEGLDGVYRNTPLEDGRFPEPLLLRADAGSATLAFQGNVRYGEQRVAEIEALVREAFVRAVAAQKSSVVLFIHGFGKSFVDAAAQAYQLRASFPACEPILYTWEAGRSGGAVAALIGVSRARQAALQGWRALSTVLGVFNQAAGEPAFASLAKVILVRSAGSLAMHEALMHGGGQLGAVDRVVLSAPLLQSEQFEDAHSFGRLNRPLVVTRNRNDQTLKFAKWIGSGHPLGLDGDFRAPQPLAVCADFTACPGVGRLHDYLMLDISERQRRLNQALLTQRQFDWQDAVQAGWVQPAGAGVFDVR